MAKLFTSLSFFLLIFISSWAQTGKIAGKVLNQKNEPLASVSVKIAGAQGGISTNIDGQFSIPITAGQKITLEFSAIGYATKLIEDVEIATLKNSELVVTLEKLSKSLEVVTVKATRSSARRETTASLIQFQKNTNTVAAVISAEAIKRSPDRNTGEVLKRVPGTSVQEGKYLVVRGLSDRYNQAMLNGILLSSSEPDRKTFSYDIFPSTMIDNIIINKAFVPEFPGEWAGGLVQVNTKDVPSVPFLNIQLGAGFNTQTIGKEFYTYKGGNKDWLGYDDGARALPAGFPTKSYFNALSAGEKTILGKSFSNTWSPVSEGSNYFPQLNKTFQASGGFNIPMGRNKLGAIFALTYNNSNKRLDYENSFFGVQNKIASLNFRYRNSKYSRDVLEGALANITLQLGSNSKISLKNILNVNTSDYVISRTGKDYESDPNHGENIRATELSFKANTFYNAQLSGDHNIPSLQSKLRWYGSFNILDQYIPDQRRIQYNQNTSTDPNAPYLLLISNTRSQKTGSRYFGFLNDYVYTAGGDATKNFRLFDLDQSVKAGYMLQVKDRLFDSRPFSIYLPDNGDPALKTLPQDQVFSPANFGEGKFGFDELSGTQFRYMANTILNAAYFQLDNQFGKKWKAVWGVRWENFDQLVGSPKKSDPRYVHNQVNDFLPGLNLTYKASPKTNVRFSASQTVIRPEFRELSTFAFFDFELGATILGNPGLQRTKVSNLDLRYEIYPRAGEVFTAGLFYKYFDKPIELYFNQSGVGTSNTFNFINADHAMGYGAELEFRKRLDFANALKNFTLQGNVSYIYNRVSGLNRPMQGQSPYLINFALQYDLEKSGLSTTLLFNEIGRRILYVGNQDVPSIWEAPRPLSDLQIVKKILQGKGELKLNITDLINQRAYFYHDIDENKKYVKKSQDALAISRKYGSSVSLTFGYTFK